MMQVLSSDVLILDKVVDGECAERNSLHLFLLVPKPFCR